jgi:hypothetical protein
MYIKLYGTTQTLASAVNLPLLEEEARAAGAATLNTIVGEDGQDYIAVLYPAGSGAGNGDVDILLAAHDKNALTVEQQAQQQLLDDLAEYKPAAVAYKQATTTFLALPTPTNAEIAAQVRRNAEFNLLLIKVLKVIVGANG